MHSFETEPPTLPARAGGLSRDAALEAAWLAAQPQHRAIWTMEHAAYPSRWRDLHKPPQVVWVQGQGVGQWCDDAAWRKPALAIVGSRNPTPQGLIHAREMARSLQALGVCIVSGLALGIDGAAHEGALMPTSPPCPAALAPADADAPAMRTVAFVGTGVDRVYPRRHQQLAHRVCERGVLVSEYPLGSPAFAHHFPQRNRLIAASVDGVLVIEAAMGSGSLITAYMALDMGKEVFAVPGSIHSPLSKGCHALLRQGATLVESMNDVLEVLLPGAWAGLMVEPAKACGAVPDEPMPNQADQAAPTPACDALGLKALLQTPTDLDTLAQASGAPPEAVLTQLLDWQLQGLVSEMSAGRYVWLHPHLPRS